jgi:hypothetical protein
MRAFGALDQEAFKTRASGNPDCRSTVRFFNGSTDQQAFIFDHAHSLAFFQGEERRRLDGEENLR